MGGVAQFNEHLIKPKVAAERPAIRKLAEMEVVNLQKYYVTISSKDERREYLKAQMEKMSENIKNIHPEVVRHWIYEAGFSFPSGHALNAFLMAMLLSYLILETLKPPYSSLFFIPFVWAVLVGAARVALGAHSAVDVTVGSLMGVILGAILIRSGVIKRLSE